MIDNLITWRILKILVTPFEKSDAFKLGIIDSKGVPLKKASDLTSSEEKEAYSYLYRLTFNIKRLLNKLPGGDKYTKNIIAAYYLIKESNNTKNGTNLEERFNTLIECIEQKNIVLVEEELIVNRFFEEIVGSGDTSGQVGGVGGVVVDTPKNNTANMAISTKPLTKKVLRRKKIVD